MHILPSPRSTLITLLGVASCLRTLAVPQENSFPGSSNTFINTTGLTDIVGWDSYSFYVHGRRIFLQSGEFHTWRLPVPALWKDIVQKAKAAGLNALSIYIHWHLLNPKKGVVDMTGINDLQPLFDAAKEAGLFVIARPGPYINAETTTGGLPGHVATIPGDPFWNPYNGEIRSNDTYYHDAWQDYWNAVIPVIAENQITNGGPVIMVQIENEYYNGPGQNEYVAQLRQRALDLGIVVPTVINDSGEFQNLVDSADIYGIDAYPVTFNCADPTAWKDIPTTWRTYHESVTPEIPFMFPEFQGGSYDPWGSKGGYAACRELTDPNFQRVHYFALWANGVTAVNFYMFYGGTSWAQLPYTNAYTSYDYGAAVAENRELSAKFGELKLQSLFLRTFNDIYKTDYQGEDNTTFAGVTTTHLQNPDTGASFYITRHITTSNPASVPLMLTVAVGSTNKTVPQLSGNSTLLGRDSFIISTNLAFGSSKLLYSTAMLLSTFQLDGNDALVVYGKGSLVYEVSVQLDREPAVITSGTTQITTKYFSNEKSFVVNFAVAHGITTVALETTQKTVVILIADYDTATNLWMPTIAGNGDLAEYVDIKASAPLLIRGPYLVRTATLAQTQNALALTGDLTAEGSTVLTVYGPSTLTSISWNGKELERVKKVAGGTWQVEIVTSGASVEIPDLLQAEWRYRDSLPEIGAGFEDESLVFANHTTTTNTFPPYYGGPWILYADDYGFHAGNLLWRGTFQQNDSFPVPTAINISVSGGIHFAASAWLNEHFLGSSDTLLATNNESWPVTRDMLVDGENRITILQDHMGGNLAGQLVCCTPGGRQRDLQQPRGLQGYYLVGRPDDAQFTKWELAGNYGGEDFPDKTRKILNEGGLYAERKGWHLPGFDDSKWELRTPFQGLDKPGVGFFRTTFNLSLPKNHDIPLSIMFDDMPGHYRSQLYINGWQMGKRVANIGPQISFVVHQGILNYEGENVIGVSVWGLEEDEGDLRIPSLRIVRDGGVYEGGVGGVGVEWWKGAGWEALRG
ncbi:putative beta-galactosidase A [Termitomyces sp. T112]|nr:putative beta-galactosidase A [Termitomyces sp. T112]